MSKELTAAELAELIRDYYGSEDYARTASQLNGWLARGDGVAVYRNQELGHPECGLMIIASFGSPAAQLEVPEAAGLPVRLPDGLPAGAINWRYQLEAAYRGDQLPPEVTT